MSDFVKNGKFSADPIELPRRKRNLIIVISWNIVLAVPILYVLYSLLRSSLLVSVPTVAAVLLIGTCKQIRTFFCGGGGLINVRGEGKHNPCY